MAQGNFVEVIGNVTREPDLKFLPSGLAVAEFGIAVNKRWLNKQTNQWEEETSFFDVTCWAELAENVTESIPKGCRVIVTGRLEQQSWEDKDTGQKRSKVKIVADEVAPSLRWATAQVTKTERREAGDQAPAQSQRSDEDPF